MSYAYTALAISLILECRILPLTIKLMDESGDKVIKQTSIYAISFGLALIFASLDGNLQTFHWFVFTVGAMNGLSVFAWIRAIRLSYSLTGLLTGPGKNCVGILLGMLLLGEHEFAKSSTLLIGVVFCILASTLAISLSWRNERASKKLEFILCIAVICAVGGTITYTLRRFSLAKEHVALSSYLLSWYGGTLASTLLLTIYLRLRGKIDTSPITKGDRNKVWMLGILFFTNMLCHKAFAEGIPIIVSQPIYLAAGSISALLIGIRRFNEGKKIGSALPLVLGFALLGIGLVVVGVVQLQ